MPLDGETTIGDLVQGPVTIQNAELDDFILLRSDGSPTYMHSVVVDDHDMAVTHVIRGDDHLNNAFRQYHLYRAFDWEPPVFAHIPLIHGADGQKLSKRHGALGVDAYRDMGYLPAAIRNYLMRLGWSHGDEEIISTAQAIEWFDLDAVGRSPSRFDFDRLESLNGHYLNNATEGELIDLIGPRILENVTADQSEIMRERLEVVMPALKKRAKNINQLIDSAMFMVNAPTYPLENAKAAKLLNNEGISVLRDVYTVLESADPWTTEAIEDAVKAFAEERSLGLGKIAQPLRAALTGSNASPGIFEVLFALGRPEALQRVANVPA
jgi:glutamyl-tRNA synthetase